ncbi:MAG: glycosyltransferase family 4 protein [Henriciella sp.]|nr:glycosyltransferase family 4 protein [Henriciella sp.]MBO6693963.1 glycosyltransferase family 4 protein [Henriciella sp.]
MQSAYARFTIATPASVRPPFANAPLVIAGLFSTANGIGEAARATYRALDSAGLSPIAVDLSAPLAPVDLESDIPSHPMPADEQGTLILQLNGPETMAALQHLGMRRGRNWYTIGYWAWELPTFPGDWHRAFRFLSEVWAISEFTAEALRAHPNAPNVRVIPHAIAPPRTLRDVRDTYRWPENTFVFLTMADGMSSLTRKNPFAAILAFKAAFGDDPNRRLIIKTRNLDHKPEAKSDLMEAIGAANNIEIMDASLSEEDLWALLNSVDCFVSLHRSEGFGLVVAEAMALGKPVICTGWSGNMDFTSAETAALVDYKLVPCIDPYGIYTDTSAHWAEVDPDDAAAIMKKVAEDPAYREQIGTAAKQHIEVWASPERVGKLMAERLSEIPVALAEEA